MFRTSFHTGFMVDYSAADAVRTIRDHGYDAVELNAETLPWAQAHIGPDTSARERAELARLGPYAAISAHNSDFGLKDDTRRNAAVGWTLRLIEQAPDYGVSTVHVIPGNDADLDSLYASMSAAVEKAAKHGVTLGLEPIVGQRIATVQATLDALRRVPGLKVNFDPSHLEIMEHDIPGAVRALGEYACHVHIKDATGSPDRWAFVELGTGGIDFVDMFRVLKSQGFGGYVSVEHESHYFSNDTRGVDQVLRESLAFIKATAKRAEAD
ncbi:sugar phosphate isomerase/epimerase family protein [Pseudochelatococcus sp. B33]